MLNLNFPSGKMSECVMNDTIFSCTCSGVARWNRANILSRFCHFTVQLALCKLSTAAPAGPLKPQRLICRVVWRRTRATPGESAWSLSQGWIHPRSCLLGARRAGMGLRRQGREAHPTLGGDSILHPPWGYEEKIGESLFMLKKVIPLKSLC